ncbi:uncharacterized protein LOC112523713 [Cynara cardunculus var. scolymus]|uniref:uncharacterized protein LOC112523713 n=1 Tax=Cynara cardunculus var. scolymus TaxID=59895 RepID=UPI000D624394|nr:uncharacterized protein LOC112523713 [Cynara cardunculus var. scolymus]
MEQHINRQPQERVGDKRKGEAVTTDFRRPRFTENLNRPVPRFTDKVCTQCHKVHQGSYNIESRVCFKCQESGHIARNCRMVRRCFTCNSSQYVNVDCPQAKGRGSGFVGRRGFGYSGGQGSSYVPPNHGPAVNRNAPNGRGK